MSFDSFNNCVNFCTNLLLITEIFDSDSMTIIIVFIYDSEVWRELCDKCNAETLKRFCSLPSNLLARSVTVARRPISREVADDLLLYLLGLLEFSFFSCDLEANKNSLFELTNTLSRDTKEFTDLLKRLFTIVKTETTGDDFSFS